MPGTAGDASGRRPRLLARPKTTRVLICALAILALLLAGQALWWARHADDPTTTVDETSEVRVPPGRPVVADEVAVQGGVEAAAKAVRELFSVDYSRYDDEVSTAVELMTVRYEEDYRATIGAVRTESVAQRVVVTTTVVTQGVMRANQTRLDALIFANQVVKRTRDGKVETTLTPLKVLVTMVHTDRGWLVDGLDTGAPPEQTS